MLKLGNWSSTTTLITLCPQQYRLVLFIINQSFFKTNYVKLKLMSFGRNSSPGLSKRIAFFLGYAKNIYLRKREMMAIIKVEWENSVE